MVWWFTLLNSSSQRSSLHDAIHFSTFSIISFLLHASSFALEMYSSILIRRSPCSISPTSYFRCFDQNDRNLIKFLWLDTNIVYLAWWGSWCSPSLIVEVTPCETSCICPRVLFVYFGKAPSFCLLLTDLISQLQTQPTMLSTEKNGN